MQKFRQLAGIWPGMRVLDLGGTAAIWRLVDVPLDITILNLPGSVGELQGTGHTMRAVEGDACDVAQFEDGSFDLVFSNSVIEHVGPEPKQRAFAAEVLRLGKAFWVQTPSKWFPVEAHWAGLRPSSPAGMADTSRSIRLVMSRSGSSCKPPPL